MKFEYPFIYYYADKKSASKQRFYFFVLIFEYSILFLTALNSFLNYEWKFIVAILLFLLLISTIVVKNKYSLSSSWYKYRALSESIKTMTWRYIMHSEPFNTKDDKKSYDEFYTFLLNIVKDSNLIPNKVGLSVLKKKNYTPSMKEIIDLPFDKRKELYLTERVEEQFNWYAFKAEYNLESSKKWSKIIVSVYIVAALSSLINIFFNTTFVIPIAIFTTIASSVLGWSQIKRFDELSSSYLLTANEIDYIINQSKFIIDEESLSNFVKDAELAFSREHTQWKARRS